LAPWVDGGLEGKWAVGYLRAPIRPAVDRKIPYCPPANIFLTSASPPDNTDNGLFTVPVNGFGPEVQLVSSGMTYDWDTVGGKNFVNESIFFSGSGADTFHSMQYMSNWEDADGSMTQSEGTTVLGPARAGKWWELDYRPGQCEVRDQWKFPQRLCRKGDRHLASMFTVVLPQKNTQGSAVFEDLYPGQDERSTQQGSVTHFGLTGEGPADVCAPPGECGDTISRSWDADVTGPFEHSVYGGWYLYFDEGTPAELSVQRVQMLEGGVLVQAMNVPEGTVLGDVRIWATTFEREYDFVPVDSLEDVRRELDGYWLDEANSTLYWRVITGYVDTDMSFGWINRETQANSWEKEGTTFFSRRNLKIADIVTRNQFNLQISIACLTDGITDAFCAKKPTFSIPGMGCPEEEVMVSINACGAPCELDGSCVGSNTNMPSVWPSAPTTVAPTTFAPTTVAPTTAAPTTTVPTTTAPTTTAPTTAAPTTVDPTTLAPTTAAPSSAAPTTMTPTSPVICDDLSKKKCAEYDVCAYGQKWLKYCLPKEGKEHECSKYQNKRKCDKKTYCKYESGACVHKCDGLSKTKCKKETKPDSDKKICRFVKETNPCDKCNPITCS